MTMLLRHRHRRNQYPSARPMGLSLMLQRAVVLLVLALILWWTGKFILSLFGFGGSINRLPASLTAEARGIVNVSLQGADLQVAEDGMMLFPGDGLKTGPNAHASLKFFDNSLARLDGTTDLVITESGQGKTSSVVRLTVKEGALWVAVPQSAASATGSVVHQIVFPSATVDLPPGTEALVSATSLRVFSAKGQGITVHLTGIDAFVVGEGQQWVLPQGITTVTDPYTYRSPLDATATQNPLLTESRKLLLGGAALAGSTSSRSGSGGILSLTQPAAGATVAGEFVTVRGTTLSAAATVEVNGHPTLLNRTSGDFSLDLAIPEGETSFEIGVEALDAEGKSIASVKRIVNIGVASGTPAGAPSIDEPAKAGETYRSNSNEIVLRGKAPTGAVGIQVNDYKLQLFTAEKGEWSYIASIALGNMKTGSNTYDVVATFADGTKSAASRLTIIQGQGDEGVVSSAAASSAAAGTKSSAAAVSSVPLQTNDPITPGVLAVTAPTPGTTHTETGTGFLLEGKTSKGTDSIWINDYRLQLYKPGVTFWNYIADVAYGNLKPGVNTFVIVARNDKGQILDRLDYVVTYEPVGSGTASSRPPRNRSSSSSR